ncbi:MAG TPA: hypothetical protein DCS48_11175 [Desulfovibrio sp.]|nr:hypothetical protein [Desulfovibrio sp.]
MKATELRKKLENEGFVNIRTDKHHKYRHPDGRTTMVPKGRKEIGLGLLKAIERQTQVKLI